MDNDATLRRAQILREIAGERDRQINLEGYQASDDDGYVKGELANASAAYGLSAAGRHERAAMTWPWQTDTFKRKDPRRDLIRAAALAVAEIERIDRQTAAAIAAALGPSQGGA